MMDFNMEIQPSFFDDECAIEFSFYFEDAVRRIGEAVIYTCEEKKPIKGNGHLGKEKIAFIKEFSILEEYEAASMKKIAHFLNVLGIKKCIPLAKPRGELVK
jgi:hypothetical protein